MQPNACEPECIKLAIIFITRSINSAIGEVKPGSGPYFITFWVIEILATGGILPHPDGNA